MLSTDLKKFNPTIKSLKSAFLNPFIGIFTQHSFFYQG